MGGSLLHGGNGGDGSKWQSGLWFGTYPEDAPHGFANRRWRLALSVWAVGNAIDKKAKELGFPNWCLGTRGDGRHIEEAKSSEHNANVKGNFVGILPSAFPPNYRAAYLVLAIDVIEEVVDALLLDEAFAFAYKQRNAIVFYYGYNHHNNRITLWGGNGEMKVLSGDVGHGHYSHNQGDYPGGESGYLPTMDSFTSWFGDGKSAEAEEGMDMALLNDIGKTVGNIGNRLTSMAGQLNEVTVQVRRVLPGKANGRGWYKVVNGNLIFVKEGTPGAQITRGLDSGDGFVIVSAIRALAAGNKEAAEKLLALLDKDGDGQLDSIVTPPELVDTTPIESPLTLTS